MRADAIEGVDGIDGIRVAAWAARAPGEVADGRNAWRERRGWLVVVEHEGVRGIGEAAPLPGFVAAADAHARARALRFALETARLDVEARRRGVPLADVLADAPAARVPVNAVVHDVAGAEAAWARGVRTLKVKVGADHARTVATLRAIRRAVPDATLRADANQTWPRGEVVARLAALEDVRLQYVEEPAAGLAPWLRAPLPVPVALDESLASPDRALWLARALGSGAVAAVVLKPTVLGGLAICTHLAAVARAHGAAVNISHALEGPVAMAACAELARALAPEHAVGLDRHAFLDAWSVAPPQLHPDAIVAAGTPGLGLDIDVMLRAASVVSAGASAGPRA